MKKAIITALLMLTSIAIGDIPQPSCLIYGMARNQYGWPLESGTVTITLTNGVSFQKDIAIIDPTVNFIVPLPLDDGKGTPYEDDVAIRGETFTLTIEAYGISSGIIQTNLPSVGEPGAVIYVKATAGTDTDGDGIPDEWEWEFVENSDGALTNINQIIATDDFDNDGMDNLTEYRSGTLAFLDYDYFYLEQTHPAANERIGITFFAEQGFSYTPYAATTLQQTDVEWKPCNYALTPDGPWETSFLTGNYQYRTIYICATNALQIISIEVQ